VKGAALPPARRSASAEASRADEIARTWAMTPLERIALALSLGRRRQALVAAARPGAKTGDVR
jgi:hypothetical protein